MKYWCPYHTFGDICILVIWSNIGAHIIATFTLLVHTVVLPCPRGRYLCFQILIKYLYFGLKYFSYPAPPWRYLYCLNLIKYLYFGLKYLSHPLPRWRCLCRGRCPQKTHSLFFSPAWKLFILWWMLTIEHDETAFLQF